MSEAAFRRPQISRRAVLLGAASAPLVAGLTGRPAEASVTFFSKIVNEPSPYEARFPDILRLNDGRIMAVWHKAAEHARTTGVIRMSFGDSSGKTWSAPHNALSSAGIVAGQDTRDPKIGLMKDGSVVLTFFTAGGGIYYAVWKPGWNYFTAPKKLRSTGYCHGAPLALDTYNGRANEVLVPFYTWGSSSSHGAWYVRTRWQASTNTLAVIGSPRRIISNANPVGRVYTEPSFVQFGQTIVCVVRASQDGKASPAIVTRWNAYSDSGTIQYQYFTGIRASSHHLLKTPDGKVLFTYGDGSSVYRPTVGMIISNPTGTWVAGRTVSIYNSGISNGDQANPSSVRLSDGSFITACYNAKKEGSTDTSTTSRGGGTLWLRRSLRSDYGA